MARCIMFVSGAAYYDTYARTHAVADCLFRGKRRGERKDSVVARNL